MTPDISEAVDAAKQYYDSTDADNFYHTVWGGEDLHLGIYETPDEPIFDASRRTVARMASKLKNLTKDAKVIDVGAGFGGSARYIAKTYGCEVVALNLSEAENERDRQKNKEQGLDHLVTVVDGNFENLPYENQSFDIVWCQDSFLHSADRGKVIEEVARVLKPGGEFIFTDPMQADDAPEDKLQPIYDRINLSSMGSPSFYRQKAKQCGLSEVEFEELTPQLTHHYARVREEMHKKHDALKANNVSDDYIQRMDKGLQHWVEGGKNGWLVWGIFHFRK
ncbi:MAG: methyltransferase domain-containing protein [Candidatus Hydrogenedentota bacterium]